MGIEAIEKHFRPQDLVKTWNLSLRTIKRMFEGEPGVLKISLTRGLKPAARGTWRIPESVVRRVHEKWSSVLNDELELQRRLIDMEAKPKRKRGRTPQIHSLLASAAGPAQPYGRN